MALEPYIDAHSHIWTPDVAHYPLAKGFTVADMQPRSFTAEELLAHCRPAGVGRVNLIQMSYYEFDNSYMLDMIKLYPDRFVGTGIVDPLAPKPDEAMRALLPKGVRAFRIAPNFSKQPPAHWLEPAGYAAMFAAAAETKQALSCLINPDGFPEVDRMCTQFPRTTVIIDHLGRIGVDGTIKPEEVDALCALAKHPKVLVKVGAFYALGKKKAPYLDLAPLIRSVVQAFGAKRCMWETDCPFQVDRDKYSDSIDLIRTGLDFLTPEDREWMLTRTAEQTLFQPLG
ncbi:amidohydrolase family protein [Singulisphaera acidiphila]|uniref:Putative TIM-barrel fold metal-dependent hydrolase n=1 Tax=Singulisphaera acidiphila (strain ATCC BAA-1392 / DSM 18658 / VKM B-2454 / MOB10) TaxID=886293 RepID=L0DK48_SINAD|nr:amidohydrolase family protein [Singulisphaera acidiphila]AGA29021.1 putative TIM-barrel fold metal-dependent hydrolase [Singulisphaera acidiphila DSM 18658]